MTETPPAPLFIVGMPRSGTTLVSMLLNAHPEVAVTPETHYFTRFARVGERRGAFASAAGRRLLIGEMLKSKVFSAFGFTEDEVEGILDGVEAAPLPGHRDVLAVIAGAYAKKNGKVQWGEKTPGHVLHLDRVLESFPEARVVNVVRDARDVSLSLGRVPWQKGNLLSHLSDWRRCTRAASRVAGDNVLTVRYEDVISSPHEAVERICAHVRVPFDKGMLEYPYKARPNFDTAVEPWKSRNVERIDSANQGKWRREMSHSDQQISWLMVGDDLEALGYPHGATGSVPLAAPRLGALLAANAWGLGRHYVGRAKARLGGEGCL